MDNSGGSGRTSISRKARKRRSNLNRRPPGESESPQEYNDSVSLSSTPSDYARDAPIQGSTKDLNLDQYNSRSSYANLANGEIVLKSSDEDGEVNEYVRPGEASGELGIDDRHSGQPGSAYDGIGSQRKFKKVKLKVGGVMHTIHARSSLDAPSMSGTSALKSSHSDAVYSSRKLNPQENSDLCFTGEKVGLRGMPWKDFSKIGFSFEKMDSFGLDTTGGSVEQGSMHGRSCKRKSVAKKYVCDELYDDENDDEIQYLQKLKNSKVATYSSNLCKENKDSQLARSFEEPDFMEEEESVFIGETELKNKNQRRVPIEVSRYSKMESSITTRLRAIQTGREVSPGLGAGPTHPPNLLPPATSRKQKEQLSEVEQQTKRAEAARRRRMQNEKATRESEAEAIRKILGQDSSRKKREEKIKKQQESRAQERASNSTTVASNVIRWVMGPTGTVVTFPDEIGLPSIFEAKPCSYPPPREKCAGPSCTNEYKYRDSKSNLPLCSLLCYKAIH